jgi:hypothetical protein
MIDKLPIETVYKIFEYLDYPLLYCKYLFPHYIVPDKYKLDYIKKIKKIPRYYPSGCNHSFSRIDTAYILFESKKLSFFDEIFNNDCSIVYNYNGVKMTTCYTCKNEYNINLNESINNSILHDICDINLVDWNN